MKTQRRKLTDKRDCLLSVMDDIQAAKDKLNSISIDEFTLELTGANIDLLDASMKIMREIRALSKEIG